MLSDRSDFAALDLRQAVETMGIDPGMRCYPLDCGRSFHQTLEESGDDTRKTILAQMECPDMCCKVILRNVAMLNRRREAMLEGCDGVDPLDRGWR